MIFVWKLTVSESHHVKVKLGRQFDRCFATTMLFGVVVGNQTTFRMPRPFLHNQLRLAIPDMLRFRTVGLGNDTSLIPRIPMLIIVYVV